MRRFLLSFLLACAVAGPAITGVEVARAADATVTLTTRANPAALTVTPGTRVTFANQSGERKRVRSEDGPVEFDSGNIESGGSWSVVVDAAGTYAYVDERDRDDAAYHGTITVSTAGQPAPGAPAPGGSPGQTAPAPAAVSVAILDCSFSPAAVTVAPGGTVTWTNQSGRDHTATGTGFDSGILGEGGRFSHSFPAAGTFSYICDIHPEMRASVTVAASAGASPSAPPAATPASPAPTAAPPAARPANPQPPTAAPAGAVAAARHEVALVDYAFRPATLSARVGDSVVWSNQGRAPHTATADGAFDTGLFRAGEQRTTVLRTAGTFRFRCTFHPEMTGVLTVAAAAHGGAGGQAAPSGSASSPAIPQSAAGVTTVTTAPPPPAEASTAAPVEVSVEDFAFAPASVRVSAGGTVTWRQNGRAPHTVSAADGGFESGLLESGATFSRQFDEAGTYQYVCAFHPQMTATIEVVAQAAASEGAGEGESGLSNSAEQAAASFPAGGGRGGDVSGAALVAALIGGAALLAGTGALLYGGSRMVAAGEGR